MIKWTNIPDHADEARKIGWGEEEEAFEGSAHCVYPSADPGRYFNAVKRAWTGKTGKTGDLKKVTEN